MPLTFVVGRPSTGKTSKLMDLTADRQGRGQVFYVVPEQFSLFTESMLLKRSKGRGLFNAEVLGFSRLAYFIINERGKARRVLEATGRGMFVRKSVIDNADKLVYYSGATDKQGFAAKLFDIFSEFRKYAVTPTDLSYAAEQAQDAALRDKLTDLSLLYGSFEQYCGDGYVAADTCLDLFAEYAPQSAALRGATVVIDGYKGFTPQEFKAIEAVLATAGDVFIALTIPQDALSDDRDSLFSEPKGAYFTLKNAAKSMGVTIAPDWVCESGDMTALSHISHNFHKRVLPPLSGDSGAVLVVAADDAGNEVRAAAEHIVSLMRDKGRKASNIAVVAADLGVYGHVISAVFPRYGIPVFIDAPRPLADHRVADFAAALIACAVGNRNYPDVCRVVKSPLSGLTVDEGDALENYALAYGLRGSSWERPFVWGGDSGWDLDGLNAARERVASLLTAFGGFKLRRRYPLKEFCRALYAAIDGGVASRVDDIRQRLAERGEADAAESYTRAWGECIELLEKTADVIGSHIATISDFGKIFDAGLANADAGSPPQTQDGVSVGDVRRSRLGDVTDVLFLGLNDGVFPGKPAETGLISDVEKGKLRESGVALSPGGAYRRREDKLLFYYALGKAGASVYLSFSRADGKGKPANPSEFLTLIKRLLPDVTVRDASEGVKLRYDGADFVTTVAGEFPTFARAMSDGTHTAAFRAVGDILSRDVDFGAKVELAAALASGETRPAALPHDIVERLYGSYPRQSASRLERYALCPFQYFAQYNLMARERDVHAVEGVDLGNLYHAAADKFVLEMIKRGAAFGASDASLAAESAFGAALAEDSNKAFTDGERFKRFTERAKALTVRSLTALNEHAAAGGFVPVFTEMSFGDGADAPPIRLTTPDGKMITVEGRVDRVDKGVVNGQTYVKVIDYKSGGRAFSEAEALAGRQMQLALYLDATTRLLGGKPAAMLYFAFKNPFTDEGGDAQAEFKQTGLLLADKDVLAALDGTGDKHSKSLPLEYKEGGDLAARSKTVDAEEFAELLEGTLYKAAELGGLALNGEIPVKPHRNKRGNACAYCSYRSLCGGGL